MTTSPKPLRRLARGVAHVLFVLMLALATAWATLAVYFQLTGVARSLAFASLALACLATLILWFQSRRKAWATFVLAAVVVGAWYQTIHPRQDRDWQAEVAHGVTADVDGPIVTLHNVRNFYWTSDSEAVPDWQTVTVNLDQLSSLDMFTSTWGNPDLAHLIVSFGFADGQHIAFSVEIRKEVGEVYSSLGGFFRKYELVLIAAQENDVVRVRTNMRHEDVHIFPVALPDDKRRDLFLQFVGLGNQLAERPKFYNTITANCTSTVFLLVRSFQPNLPLDRRIILSGRLPEYIDEMGGLQGDMPMDQRRAEGAITARAQTIGTGQDFSAFIRGDGRGAVSN